MPEKRFSSPAMPVRYGVLHARRMFDVAQRDLPAHGHGRSSSQAGRSKNAERLRKKSKCRLTSGLDLNQ